VQHTIVLLFDMMQMNAIKFSSPNKQTSLLEGNTYRRELYPGSLLTTSLALLTTRHKSNKSSKSKSELKI
jgi:hypothetical protein